MSSESGGNSLEIQVRRCQPSANLVLSKDSSQTCYVNSFLHRVTTYSWSLSSNPATDLKLWLLTRGKLSYVGILGELGEVGYVKYKDIGRYASSTCINFF